MVHVVSSPIVLASFSNMSGKCKFSSTSAIQVKRWQKTVSMEEKLDIISQLGEGEQIVDMCCNV